jgi:hypothetical protein
MSAWKWVSRIVIWSAVCALAFQVADKWARRSGPLPDIPEPNGYETLISVARTITLPEDGLTDMPPEKVRTWVSDKREDLDRIRLALRTESGIPLSTDPKQNQAQLDEIRQLKRLAVLLGLRARAELVEGKTNAAARSMLDTILLGQAMGRGGLMVHALNAMAVERVGVASLKTLAPMVDGETHRDLARTLEQAETRRESADRILQTEQSWRHARFGLVARVMPMLDRKSEGQRQSDFLQRHQETVRATRRLLLNLAIRAWSNQNGRAPKDASEIVPSFLKAIPLDPKTGAPIEP